MPLALSPQVFAITAQLIEERAGLHYDVTSIDLLADKLSDRAIERGFHSLLDYYYLLRYDPQGDAELDLLVETLVVHETYFFRELDSIRVLVHTVLPAILREHGEVRIWSAACATGEEPYTLAILLSVERLLDRVEIVASDISARALAKAREGVYSGRSLRCMPADRSSSFLEETHGGVRVCETLRKHIAWRRVNLLDLDAVRALGVFDLVICRNVLIYFGEPTVARVARNLGEALRPHGLLLLGASESLLRFGTLFACEERAGTFFYRKAGP